MALQVEGGCLSPSRVQHLPGSAFAAAEQTLVMVMLCVACGPGLMAGTIYPSLECRSGRQPWVVCRMVASSPGERMLCWGSVCARGDLPLD